MAKTKPIGVRFDEDFLLKMKAQGIVSPQKLLNYLTNLAKESELGKQVLNEIKNTPSKSIIRDISETGEVKATYDLQTKEKVIDNEETKKRIFELEKELSNPPKTAQIGIKNWIRIRENELEQLKGNDS